MRGPAVMLGYWQRPDATAETLRDGWLHTGDLGRFDEHGYLYLLDRAKDMIITGGSNVYAVEVEDGARRPPDGAGGRGGRHPRPHLGRAGGRGRRVRRPAPTPTSLDGTAAVRSPGTSSPRRYVFRRPLPRNAYGKVLKRELRDDLAR